MSSKNKNNKKKNIQNDYDDEAFVNSEDEYSQSDYDSSDDDQVVDDIQSGGETDRSEQELDSDDDHLDRDPDDEKPVGIEEDDDDEEFDPVVNEELEDPDQDNDNEDADDEIDDDGIDEGDADEDNNIDNEDDESGFVVDSKQCHLKNLDKDFIVLDEDDSNMYGKMEYKKISDSERISDPVMTYYEMVRIIGTRSQQFNFGSEPLIDNVAELSPPQMAYVELIAKMTPFIIRRHLPGKKYEDWRIDELEIIHKISDSFFVPDRFDWQYLMSQINKNDNKNIQSRLIKKK